MDILAILYIKKKYSIRDFLKYIIIYNELWLVNYQQKNIKIIILINNSLVQVIWEIKPSSEVNNNDNNKIIKA